MPRRVLTGSNASLRRSRRNQKIGGVGGRDYMHIGGVLQDGRARVVGKVPLFGKHIGNHHLGFGEPREVDMLKA
jgi:hypothetical protein